MNKQNLLILLLSVTFFKGIIWSAITPLWHAPDEQAHFGQVQNIVEMGRDSHGIGSSNEIILSEELLGTYRDEMGKNRFTHHPEYNIPFSETQIGFFEEEINNIPLGERKKFIKTEATNYPPLFYLLSAIPYRIFYQSGLITRAFAVRFPSIIFSVFTVYFTYLISSIIFPANFLFQITSTSLVSFQPMFTFVSAGTNSDNLFNLIFTIFIYLFLKLIQKFNFRNLSFLLAFFLAGIYTKVQMYSALLPLVLIFIFFFFKYIFQKKAQKNKKAAFLIISYFLAIFLIILKYLIEKRTKGYNLIPEISLSTKEKAIDITFIDHIFWTLRHTIAEVVPWYWGVFKWLGVALPRGVNRIINRFCIIAVIGLFIKIIAIFKKREFNRQNLAIFVLVFFTLYYFIVLMIWDYFFRIGHGFSLGFQGRYYFPTIAPHMILLLIGFISLVPQTFDHLKNSLAKTLVLLMVLLNFIGLYTLTNSYYDLSNLKIFLTQVSQYKPYLYKSPFLVFLSIIYLSILVLFLFNLVKYQLKKSKR